ncbi:MAG TPA: alanine racemase, partial [Methylophilaceae bacterium]
MALQTQRPLKAIIHGAALRHNLGVAKSHAPQSKIMAVVKANGYGHGLLRVAESIPDVDGFAVLGLDEAIALREAGYSQTIMLLEGLFRADALTIASAYHLSPVVHNEPQLQMLEAGNKPVEVFMKINTGMNRLGFVPDVFGSVLKRLESCANVSNVTLMTHFANADESAGISDQLAVFDRLTAGCNHARTLANSATVFRYPQAHADWVRPGIMLYGSSPFSDVAAASLNLRPAMSLSSEIIAIQHLKKGDSVGYGSLFHADKPMRLGVVACGYADGYPRHSLTGTPIAVNGHITRTLGRVSMDMLYADITDIPDAEIGSPVELWGK